VPQLRYLRLPHRLLLASFVTAGLTAAASEPKAPQTPKGAVFLGRISRLEFGDSIRKAKLERNLPLSSNRMGGIAKSSQIAQFLESPDTRPKSGEADVVRLGVKLVWKDLSKAQDLGFQNWTSICGRGEVVAVGGDGAQSGSRILAHPRRRAGREWKLRELFLEGPHVAVEAWSQDCKRVLLTVTNCTHDCPDGQSDLLYELQLK
jgi:hypothetical protein